MSYFAYPGQEEDDRPTFMEQASQEDWAEIIQQGRMIHFEPGTVLVHAGEEDSSVYILIQGSVEVMGRGTLGFERQLAIIPEGSVFGEIAFFDQLPRLATIRGLSPGKVLRLSRNGLSRLAHQHPQLAHQILLDLGRILALRFRELPGK